MDSDADRIIPLYQRHARAWDERRGDKLFETPWLDRFLSLLPTGGSVLDLGCGSGRPLARYIIAKDHVVTGVDSSVAMIDLCKARFPHHRWLVADMRQLRLEQKFNGILAWDSFFHLRPDDQRRMFRIFREHAAERGALMFTAGPRDGVAMGTFEGEPLYHASLDPPAYRLLLHEAGFEVVSYVPEDPTCGFHTIWLAQLR
jgi:SAM-dependent methyltransferase